MTETAQYSWIPSYKAIASKLSEKRSQEAYLLNICNRHANMQGVSRMDPLTFMALFNRHQKDETRGSIIADVLSEFGLKEQRPQDYCGIPVVNNQQWRFMDGQDSHIDEKWDFFECACRFAAGEKDETEFARLFDIVLGQKNIGLAKLTMALFWCFPESFLPLDSNTARYLADAYFVKVDKNSNGSEYLGILKEVRDKTDLSFEAISAAAYNYDGWGPLPSVFDPGIDQALWFELVGNEDIFTPVSMDMLSKMLELGGSSTCKELSEAFGDTPNHYNAVGASLGERVALKLDIEPHINQWGGNQYWSVPFLGKAADKDQAGAFVWKIRPELKLALEGNAHLLPTPDNAPARQSDPAGIASASNGWWLTASPKIWSFADIAIGEEQNYTLYNEKGNPRRIHKNFIEAKPGDVVIGYEATPVKAIVSICEISHEHDDERMYFKKVRDLTTPIPFETIKTCAELTNMEFLKNPNGSFFRLSKAELEAILELAYEDEEAAPTAAAIEPYSDEDFLADVYMERADYEDLKGLAAEKKNLILQGAPGTGKTFAAERLAWAIMGCKDRSRVERVQFHQSTSYDEFVIGFKPNAEGGFFIEEGPFVKFCNKAAADKDKVEYFFIIDEINRANVSKVFGELLMLIEDSHRGEPLKLGIDGRRFCVPENVTIIGMMNTADRGLALIDYALRRRFAFFEMQPALDNQAFMKRVEECEDQRMPALVDAVRKLNRKIAEDPALGDGFRIGHSYFCKKKEAEPGCVDSIIKYELIPLIREYWFDDRKTADTEIAKLRSLQ